MFEVLESVELLAIVLMVALAMWIIDVIQRRLGHPLHYILEEEEE